MAFTRIRGESRAEGDMNRQQQESRRARRRSACVCLRAGGEETNKKDATCDMGGWCGPSVRKLCLLSVCLSLSPEAQRSDVPTEGAPMGVRRELER